MGEPRAEESKTKEIIEKFESKYGFELREVNRKINNYRQYKYDIEVLQDNVTVAIIEAKIKKNTTTDGIIASLLKATYERKENFGNDVHIVLLFYINNQSKIEEKDAVKKGVLRNLNSLLKNKVDFKIMNINITNDLDNQLEELDEQLHKLIN